jgi:hypothetical protein
MQQPKVNVGADRPAAEFKVLGSLEVSINGKLVSVSSGLQEIVLALLLLACFVLLRPFGTCHLK